jgi:hypothetical protein
MLQRVALGQIRFNLPGLGVDGRGVVAGKQGAARFGAIDRLVSFLRVLSGSRSLDDLQPGLRIVHARAAGGTREAIVLIPSGSTHLMDAVARAARTVGGQCFTGNGKHFVLYRDARAPLGYDAVSVAQDPAELVFYGPDNVAAYQVESELPLAKLLLRLSLQRQPGFVLEALAASPLYLTARRGLGPLMAEYLHRAQFAPRPAAEKGAPAPMLRASAALCEATAEAEGAFQSSAAGFWLFRIEGVPPRMMGLLSRTPGLDLYTPVIDNVVVAAGYRHPIHLDSCKASFPADHFYLFSRSGAGVTVLTPTPVLAPLEDLVRIRSPRPVDQEVARASPAPRPDLTVPLRLEGGSDLDRFPVATLIPWGQVGWLQRLCYALPAPALRGHRVALLDRGVLVISSGVLEGFPFGVLLDMAAPDVFVPLGARLRPAVSPGLLAERAGAGGGAIVVFPAPGEAPFRVPADAIEPLERRTLSHPDLADAERDLLPRRRGTEVVPPLAIEIENDPLGPMPLWGLGPPGRSD